MAEGEVQEVRRGDPEQTAEMAGKQKPGKAPERRRVPVRLAEARARVVEPVAGGGGREGRRGGGRGGGREKRKSTRKLKRGDGPDAPGGNQVRVMEPAVGDGG